MFGVRHKKVSAVPDSGDTDLVQPSDWNDDHEFFGESPGLTAGFVAYFAGTNAPSGWLEANGAAVSRETYGALFAALGTLYGDGDGATTFVLPDLRGEFLRGADLGRGVDVGRVVGGAQEGAVQAHKHGTRTSASPGSSMNVQDFLPVRIGAAGGRAPVGGEVSDWGVEAGGVETRPRNVALLACIKV